MCSEPIAPNDRDSKREIDEEQVGAEIPRTQVDVITA